MKLELIIEVVLGALSLKFAVQLEWAFRDFMMFFRCMIRYKICPLWFCLKLELEVLECNFCMG